MSLQEAIDAIVSTHGDPLRVAMGCPVDAKEVEDALFAADPDTAEAYALRLLAQLNPYKPPTPPAKTEK